VVVAASADPRHPGPVATALGQAGLWAGLLASVAWASRLKGSGRVADDFGLRARWGDMLVGLPIGIADQLLVVPLIYLPLQFFRHSDLSKAAKELAGQFHGAAYAGFAVVVIVGASIVEELFFRGLVLRSLERRFGTGWAVVGSAAAFGVAHLQPLQLPALFVLGIILALLVTRTGRLGPAIAAHAAFNAATVVALALQR
jgi:membrane protease YdiL (CAAX protease family)